MAKKKNDPRIRVLCIILACIFALYSVRIAVWQIGGHDEYISQLRYTTAAYSTIKASRGEIVDRYGRPLAKNTAGYNIVFDASYFDKENTNDIILKLCTLLTSLNESWNDGIPLDENEPFGYTDRGGMSKAVMFSKIGVNDYATAENCFDAMVERYSLQQYSRADQRTIMGVRLTMEVADFAPSIPFTFAKNVSLETVTVIKEASSSMPGVVCEVVANREYVSGVYAPHIVGNIGPIYAEEWNDVKEKGYSYSDYIGKTGIEKYAEDYLRGKDGKRRVIKDSSGNVLSSDVIEAPESGGTVYLTMDLNLQSVCYNTLENLIKSRSATKDGASANAGAIVVMDVNNGDVLASVTYPSYDMNTYNTDYESLLKNSAKPLFNRAFNGTYAPGSTFKPATAAIGLQLGKITSDETIFCAHTYTYYNDYQPTCMGYHKDINVINALKVSCNYFFYELGRRIGITELNNYCRQFGFGEKTGIELSESSGILAGKTYRESINTIWNDGDTLQAAIGQSDNLFTPLQMSSYIATLANGGTRYRAHLIKEIRSSNLEEQLEYTDPEVLGKVQIEQQYLDIVKKGMLSVTTEGSISTVFKDYPIQVGGKTGTATIESDGKRYNNAVFVSFAPYENPEIAVIILAEKAGYGSTIAYAAESIFDAYFYYGGNTYSGGASNTLLQ